MCVMKKSLSSAVVLTTFLLTTSAFAMKRDCDDGPNNNLPTTATRNKLIDNEPKKN